MNERYGREQNRDNEYGSRRGDWSSRRSQYRQSDQYGQGGASSRAAGDQYAYGRARYGSVASGYGHGWQGGENVGDRLDFWAEGGTFNLPNAFVQVHYASGRHIYDGPCNDRATCFWLNERYPVRVRTLEPDIAAPLTFEAYRALRDPALDAVLAREARRRSSAHTP